MGLRNQINIWINFIKWRMQRGDNYTSIFTNADISKISVGDYTYGRLNIKSYGNPNEKLSIGRFCSIGSDSQFILSGGHSLNCVSTYPFRTKFLGDGSALCDGPIVIEDDVWIGESAIILSGITIGQGAVVGAGAVVTKDIPPYAVVGGVPAEIIKYRFSPAIIEKLRKVKFEYLNKNNITNDIEIFEKNLNEDNLDEVLSFLIGDK